MPFFFTLKSLSNKQQLFFYVLGTCDLRLNSSRLFYMYLCKLNLVVQTKCWKGALCMDYEAKFTEVKQAR